MLKIRALNRESSSDEEVPAIRREAQEEIALELYNKALKLQLAEAASEAEDILLNLINENIPSLEKYGSLPHTMSTFKYSCYLNIGNIHIKKGELNQALDYYICASRLDSTDVTLWYKIGKLAIKQNRFYQAAYALTKGLECNKSHWPCLDEIISLLYAMKDTLACLTYIGRALMLDSAYLKGLVIRKKIFLDNPAAADYYKKIHPEHIWEPSIDCDPRNEEIKDILEYEQLLCDKIVESEKCAGPKSLQTIPLPTALNNFTWLSLGEVVLHLYQYLTLNNLSHLSMVNISKCMSSKEESLAEINGVDLEKPIEQQTTGKYIEATSEEEHVKMKLVVERRPSQNSETNNDCQESTPVHTDNEEQVMDHDGDEQDENTDSNKSIPLKQSTKRKRDLLSDLQIWGWHSKRKTNKKGKPDKDFSIEDALNRIIPHNLLKYKLGYERPNNSEDSIVTTDTCNIYNESVETIKNREPYFGTECEKEDVKKLWLRKREFCDAVTLIKDFVITLSKLWNVKWPSELINIYVKCYGIFRNHYDHPDFYPEDVKFGEVRDDALATLLYGELVTFNAKLQNRCLGMNSITFLQIISGWQKKWMHEFPEIFIRVYWLKSHLFSKEGNNEWATGDLELVQELIKETESAGVTQFGLSLPNCSKNSLVTYEVTSRILKNLDMISSLNCLEELYAAEKFEEVAEILQQTFIDNISTQPICGKMGRPAQLAILLHSLWFIDLTKCFVWTEKCLAEAVGHFLKPGRHFSKWEKIVEKCLELLHKIIKMETVGVVDALTDDNQGRLIETLSKIVCKQINVEGASRIPLGTISPWILLHFVLLRNEHRQQATRRVSHIKSEKVDALWESTNFQNDDIPPSLAILFSAHEFLGPKGWCLTTSGELLHFILDTVLDRLDTPIFEALREKIDIHIEQSLFCLYQHPSKKNKISRHLADHNVDPLPLTWERAFQLYEFYGPDCLPEYNSYKNVSISADLEQLLQRIIELVPSEIDPQPHTLKIYGFIHGKSSEVPSAISFPNKVRAIYYLIGDFYFKQREFNRCIKYFIMDLCINPLRVDSWACIGLSYLSQLEGKLNYCKNIKSEMKFLDKAKCAKVSFQKALELATDHIMLWIEYGSFEYMVHSFCSRILKSESDTLSMEKFENLENQKNAYLKSCGYSFEKAIELYQPDEGDADERWLQYYMLGKVAEKKQKEPSEYLQYYVMASKLLNENNAVYPEKINYYNPQHLSVEVLEMHYRIYASILKYLELHEGKNISNALGHILRKYLETTNFPRKTATKRNIEKVQNTSLQDFVAQSNITDETGANIANKSEVMVNTVAKFCIEDILDKVELSAKQELEAVHETHLRRANTNKYVGDVIMISDSEEEHNFRKIQSMDVDNVTEKPHRPELEDVQDVLDKMMAETMKTADDQEVDSDTSTTSKIAVEVKSEEEAVETKSKKITGIKVSVGPNTKCEEIKLTSESDNDADLRISRGYSTSSSGSSSSSASSSDSDSDDDSGSSSSSISSETCIGNMTTTDTLSLIDKCVMGLEQCVIRFPQHYKALYRLAHLYFNYKSKKDLTKSRQLLLGEYTCKGGVKIAGLFSDRKNHNFFNKLIKLANPKGVIKSENGKVILTPKELDQKIEFQTAGIWRIPCSEIDRPGSLSAHMSRSIALLLQILHINNDSQTLFDVSIQFRRSPEPDKIYIKDLERLQFSDQAMAMCIQSFKFQIQNMSSMGDAALQKLLLELFRSYQKVQKHDPGKESTFSSMLVEVYRKLVKDKISENGNVLDLATKFCQQNYLFEHQKRQMQNPPALLKAHNVTNLPPVLPTPSMVGSPGHPLLKRPGSSRPRGRPPLPKNPGQVRPAKNRSSVNSYAWQKSALEQKASLLSQNYLKHYQEELIKQYTKSFSLTQLTQSYLQQNQFANQFNQFLAGQNPLLNNQQLIKQMSAGYHIPNLNKISQNQLKTIKDVIPTSSAVTSSRSVETLASDHQSSITELFYTASKQNLPYTITPHAHASVSKNQVSTRSPDVYNLTSQGLSINKLAQFVPKDDGETAKTKTMLNRSMFTSNYGLNYSTADLRKTKPGTSTKVLSNSQIFKEPPISKTYSSIHHKPGVDKDTKLLMNERPNISITPILPCALPLATSPPFRTQTQRKSGKTLQEKLADKQKQHSTQHLTRNSSSEGPTKDSAFTANVLKQQLPVSNVPSSLTVTKSSVTLNFPLDAGVSTQIPDAKE